MNKILIAYFSASGVTKEISAELANLVSGDLFEIIPKIKYTSADLDWTDNDSRTTKEKEDESFRPEILNKIDISKYDTIYLGFPVWWYKAPNIIYSFLDSYDFSKKEVIPFCTSGGTGIDGCENKLQEVYPNINFKKGKRLTNINNEILKEWIDNK